MAGDDAQANYYVVPLDGEPLAQELAGDWQECLETITNSTA